jgi:PD-(D/E)XK nuclease superfamily
VTPLLPVLSRSLHPGFNVFDVMHHGTHEKQISNVFRWLLETDESHRLGDRFLRIFIDEVNRGLDNEDAEEFVPTAFLVLQEVNTAAPGHPEDIADLVLQNEDAVIVVENYFTSDGHGHSYDGYLTFSQRDGRDGAVALLCSDKDSSLQAEGWENASVITYGRLLERLREAIESDHGYQRTNPEQCSFIDQMHRKFAQKRGRMQDHQVIDFVAAMCATGEAGRFAEIPHTPAAERFANEVAVQALERFGESRELLLRVKGRLRNFSSETLKAQLDATQGDGFVSRVSANYSGTYQWTVNFHVHDDGEDIGEFKLALKFGPSAWFANEKDPHWERTVDPGVADYSHLFLTRTARVLEVRQSEVTLQEVLDGLAPSDFRLHDEIVQLLRDVG